jgi:hypothetical protein
MTAQEREASLDRLCEQDEGYREDEADEYGGFEPLTAEELAEIREAAADELLAVAADAAAGADDRFAGVSEAELLGVVCAWDLVEAHAGTRKLAAIAELARRNPGPSDQEFTADQVAYALGESRGRAGTLVDLAQTLETRLPGTRAALDDGTVFRYKAEITARATALLDAAEARAAEDYVVAVAVAMDGFLSVRKCSRFQTWQ